MSEQTALEIKDLHAGYGETEILKGINLIVEPAQTVAIIGPNGAGKSTVVKSILVSDDSGSGTTITVTLVDSSSNIFSLFKSKSVSANTTVELLTQPLVMEASEVLKVQAAYANRLHVVASILEIEPREVTT